MKKTLLWMVVVTLIALPAAAQFQQIIEMQVKPGHEIAYENYMKKIKEAADEVGSPQSWSTFSVAVGKAGPTYRVGLLFEKWGDRDAWHGVRQMLVQAFGEQEGSKIYSEGGSHIESLSSRVWEVIEDGTANPQTVGNTPSPFYTVTIRWVKPGMVNEYRGILRQFTTAYEAADSKPSVTRWVLRTGEGQGTTFRRTQPFETWSDRDAFNAPEIINAQFGADGALLFERSSNIVLKTSGFVSAYRPDLSRIASASTSDE